MSKMMPRGRSPRSSSALPVPYRLPCTSAHSRNAPCSIRRRNWLRSTKWYSRPFCSFWRGLRVVCDTLKRSCGISLSKRAVSVVLPAPEGEDTINGRGPSLDILDLLPDPLQLCLHLHDQMGDFRILALCANGIRFSTDFLQQKIEATANGALCSEHVCKLVEMRIEPDELFRHVAAVRQNHHFRLQAAGIELHAGFGQQAIQALAQPRSVTVQHLSATGGDRPAQTTR